MSAEGFSFGYDPYDNGNVFMESWFKATQLDGASDFHPQQLHALTSDPERQAGSRTDEAPTKRYAHYRSFLGVPNDWLLEFARQNKAQFEDHFRAQGYEIDLADTPGLGQQLYGLNTLDGLERIIDPKHNPGNNFRQYHELYMSQDALAADYNQAGTGFAHANGHHVTLGGTSQRRGRRESASDNGEGPSDAVVNTNAVTNSTPAQRKANASKSLTWDEFVSYCDAGTVNGNGQNSRSDAEARVDHDSSETNGNTTVTGAGTQQQPIVVQDNSAIIQQEILDAGVDLTTCDVVDDQVASEALGRARPPTHIDEQDALEKETTSANFYVGMLVHKSASPHHQPVVDTQRDFTNIRQGIEHIPKQWQHNPEIMNDQSEDGQAQAGMLIAAKTTHEVQQAAARVQEGRAVLPAKPQTEIIHDSADLLGPDKARSNDISKKIIGFIDKRQRKHRAKPPSPVNTDSLLSMESWAEVAKEYSIKKKRSADHTFSTRSATLAADEPDRDSGSKRARRATAEEIAAAKAFTYFADKHVRRVQAGPDTRASPVGAGRQKGDAGFPLTRSPDPRVQIPPTDPLWLQGLTDYHANGVDNPYADLLMSHQTHENAGNWLQDLYEKNNARAAELQRQIAGHFQPQHVPKHLYHLNTANTGNHQLQGVDKDEAAERRRHAYSLNVLDLNDLPDALIGQPTHTPTPVRLPPSSPLPPLPTPMTPNPPAYTGQFTNLKLMDLYSMARQKCTIRNMPRSPLNLTFGDRLHPNPLITHPAIPNHAPTLPIGAFNYTHRTIPPNHRMHDRLEIMGEAVDAAATHACSRHRNASQENLRREVHRELAAARLEGFPIGEYRYYQGHLTTEEYVEKGLCVCWGACGCSGWCSRFGDLVCPCNGVLELDVEDSETDTASEDAEETNLSEEGYAQTE